MKKIIVFIVLISSIKINAQHKMQMKNQPNFMVHIWGGIYLPLYSLDSQKVKVRSFEMDVYQVTNKEYLKFVKNHPEWRRSKAKKLFIDENYLHHWINDTTITPQQENQPVVNISWFAAMKYLEEQGKRLPTNAEWELVGQASITNTEGYRDEKFNQWLLDWVSKPQPINQRMRGSTFKNAYGVYDMHGLIWEWTYDFNSALTTGESRENGGLDKSLFCGGGSFASKDVRNYAAFMRYAMRSSLKAKYSVANLGFRGVK